MSVRSWFYPRPQRRDDDLTPPVDLPSGLDRAARAGKVLSGYVRIDALDFEQLVTRATAAEERARSAEELLFENGAELGTLTKQLDELNHENVELQQALDVRRPAATPAVLGPLLQREWDRGMRRSGQTHARWHAIAETAIDHVRGLWPVDEPAFHGPSCTCPLPADDVAALDAEADRRLDIPLCGSPQFEGFACSLPDNHSGQHEAHGGNPAEPPYRIWPKSATTDVAGSSEEAVTPAATSWAGEPPAPGDPTLARAADEQIEALAQTIAERQLSVIAGGWDTTNEPLRDHFRDVAADVVLAGWRPPVGALVPTGRVTAVAQVLYAHEPDVDATLTTCSCGWDGAPIHHVEHVAEQLVALGALA